MENYKVIKRNGITEPFTPDRIRVAMFVLESSRTSVQSPRTNREGLASECRCYQSDY